MTDAPTPTTPAIPAGWYPDPSNAAQQRWWDGTQWTEQVSAPYVAAAQQKAPEGTNVQTPWIWLVVLLPLLSLVGLFTIDIGDMMRDILANPSDPNAAMEAQLAMYTNPAFLITGALSWLVIAATILFAFFDFRELKRRGVPAPFHWAFAFLAIASLGVVYPIGRSVVVKRRTGKNDWVLLAAILSIVVYLIVVIVFVVVIFNQMFAIMGNYPGLR